MKTVNEVLSLHPTSNQNDNVIRLTHMPTKRHWGYIDEKQTIFVNKDISPKQMQETIRHEKVHKKQMQEGRLKFHSNFYEWKGKKSKVIQKIPTKMIDTKRRDLPWELEADGKPLKHCKIKRNIKRKRK